MSAVIVRNSRSGDSPPEPPRTAQDTLYPYAMFFDGGKYIAYADDPVDLLSALTTGYADLDDAGQMQARIRLAIDAQVALQAVINAEADPAALAALTEEETAALTGPCFEQPRIDFWYPEIPLVVVESGYQPYTDINRPISGIADVEYPPNMIWLKPLDEWDLLVSLADAGYISLSQATDL
ncbi:hypothetical protein GB931_09385 [Modestobacter sp. I12A-02628]|uniref:Uncharacterized protein n=1 Tax=Goekera deserti TaxID=2497753 RepID=A0A7K3WME1_9ACTN|nr:hypothetical protein [Goekera deserti]MPQ98129.1 hypothetical protein [Goekera deserti]NDI48777.1 hypothetical protein [Goekera deserti]NEL56703.1 hypothetical protein [Goekera deserti]